MTDMLVRLYDLKLNWGFVAEQANQGYVIRKPIGAEKSLIVDWVRKNFSDAWASETDLALGNIPRSCFIAHQADDLVGFACYDCVALGYFGPVGVQEAHRNQGIGRALLLSCLLDMKLKGYGYAVIGGVGPSEFYMNSVNAIEIPDSTPGIWEHWLQR